MDYALLTDADREHLRQQRILQLESDHYRIELVLRETTDPDRCAALVGQQSVLEQAIAAHDDEQADRSESVTTKP
jgi:hypothetical protein